MAYPWLEARKLKDKRSHHLLQRPRYNPERVGIGMMAFTYPGASVPSAPHRGAARPLRRVPMKAR